MSTLDVTYLEEITTADISNFIGAHVRSVGLAPKTANRYREVLHTFFSWAINEQGIRTPGNENPVSKVSEYKKHALKIRFLTLTQVKEQLEALEENRPLQTMVAMLIYAGFLCRSRDGYHKRYCTEPRCFSYYMSYFECLRLSCAFTILYKTVQRTSH